jgi:hypothetical protein
VKRAVTVLVLIGLAGVGISIAVAAVAPTATATSICAAWWVGLSFALGALAAVMVLNISHATWFVVFRPITSSIAATVPVLALGLLPAALVAHHVYPWAGATAGLSEDVLTRLARTRPWMSPWPVYVRTLVSLGVWSAFALWLYRTATSSRARVTSGIGIPVLAITGTVTPWDWMMRVEPAWKSSIYGMYVLVGGFYGAMGLVSVVSWLAVRLGRIPPSDVKPDHFHALGRLMLTAVCLWAYVAFFQWMLIWIGNLPAEVTFFTTRSVAGWAPATYVLVFGHFVVPFFLLLSRPLKRRPGPLACVGALMVLTHIVDVLWLILPSKLATIPSSIVPPLAAALGLGGAWGLWRFAALDPVASSDPEFSRGVSYESP